MIGYLTPNYPLVAAFRALPATRKRPADPISQRIFKTAPRLGDFFRDGEILASKGDIDRPISGLAMDSRRVLAGNLFFALPGPGGDGGSLIDEAIQRGAVAVVVEKIPSGTAARVTYVQVASARQSLARVAQRYFNSPDRSLDLIGVAGTHGKTTVTTILKHLLSAPAQRVGLVGTVQYDLGARVVPSLSTTPESLELYGLLAQMRDAGCRQAAVELSAEGLEHHHVLGMRFGVAVFTNLSTTGDLSPDAFARIKSQFGGGTEGPAPRAAVINLDDVHGRQLVAALPAPIKLVTFGESPDAVIRAENVRLGLHGTALRLRWPAGSLEIESPFVGRHNVSNLLAAFAACYAQGRDLSVVAARLKSIAEVPGRMERIAEGQPFNVFVDYAPTVESLRQALGALRPVTSGRLFVVFGCEGDRERCQRPLMAAAAQEFADFAWGTADNPRNESLGRIFSDMRTDLKDGSRITFVEDRRRAIALSLEAARAGDCVLIAGRGHETFQELAGTIVPFDDRQVARDLIAGAAHQAA